MLTKNAIHCESVEDIAEVNTFYAFRTDTRTVLAKGIIGYDAAKERANRFRKPTNLRWDQIQFKAQRKGTSEIWHQSEWQVIYQCSW